MKLYNQLSVTITYQNYGSSWVLILRGKTEEIEQCVNGLYNWDATDGNRLSSDGSAEYHDAAKTIAIVWSSQARLTKFFFKLKTYSKLAYIEDSEHMSAATKRKLTAKITVEGKKFAHQKMAELRENHEPFFNFRQAHKEPEYVFQMGSHRAEKPDSDFKDAVLSHAFNNQDAKA